MLNSSHSSLHLLDLGCGSGQCSTLLQMFNVNSTYTGVDFSSIALNKAVYPDNIKVCYHHSDIYAFLAAKTGALYTHVLADDSFYYLQYASFVDSLGILADFPNLEVLRFSVKTDRDRFVLQGTQVSDYTYRVSSGWESNLEIICLSETMINEVCENIFGDKFSISIGYEDFLFGFGDLLKSNWIVTLERI